MNECDMKVPGKSQRTEDEQCSRFQTEFETPSLLIVSRLFQKADVAYDSMFQVLSSSRQEMVCHKMQACSGRGVHQE